jgi:hypothetical protein
MPQLYLPTEHTDADLVLATQVAEAVDAGELFVVWSAENGPGAPAQVLAVVREPAVHPVAGAFAALFASIGNVIAALKPRRHRGY